VYRDCYVRDMVRGHPSVKSKIQFALVFLFNLVSYMLSIRKEEPYPEKMSNASTHIDETSLDVSTDCTRRRNPIVWTSSLHQRDKAAIFDNTKWPKALAHPPNNFSTIRRGVREGLQ
jgi:hypothetical protein